MPKRLEISHEAIKDLEEIWDYIAADNPNRADQFIDEIYKKCREIARLDGVGRRRDELIPGLLSIPFRKKYLVFFLRTVKRVQIVRILHGAREIGGIFEA